MIGRDDLPVKNSKNPPDEEAVLHKEDSDGRKGRQQM